MNEDNRDHVDKLQPKTFIHRYLWWILLAGLILILGFGIFLFPKLLKKDKATDNSVSTQSSESSSANCPPVFTYEFTDYSKIQAFQPIGSITGASRGRSYVTINSGETVSVYAPTDATLISVIYAYRGADAAAPEYGFKFDTKCGVTFLLDHLDTVSDELKQYAPAEASRSTATSDNLSVPIKAGTLLGTTNGTPQARTFDFLVIDKNHQENYIKAQRWQWEQSLYSVCPYDLYQGESRDKYYQKIGQPTESGLRKADTCGKISHDIADTISGGWFATDDATDTKGKFMLIGEIQGTVDVTIKNDSEGTLFRLSDYSPTTMPSEVGVGESVCYKGYANDWAYLKLLDGNTIEINNGTGSCPSSFPPNGKQTFKR